MNRLRSDLYRVCVPLRRDRRHHYGRTKWTATRRTAVHCAARVTIVLRTTRRGAGAMVGQGKFMGVHRGMGDMTVACNGH